MLRTWRARLEPLAIIVAAVLVGGYLRFANLGFPDLSQDEAASWAAASAPTLMEVLRRQLRLNPGELGVHDVALHFWMVAFGDGPGEMRSLSAAAGTLGILLVFLLTREILELAYARVNYSEIPANTNHAVNLVAAVATLLFAVNLVTIKYARETRMYPLALLLTLAQAIFFLRVLRSGQLVDAAATALLTALTIAATYTAGLILVPEGLFLGILLLEKNRSFSSIAFNTAPLLCGVLAVVPLYLLARRSGGGPNLQTWDWIKRPPPWAIISLFNKATGTYNFPLLAILATAGAVRGRARWRCAIVFMLMWMLTPPILLIIVSYVFHPAFVERYLLACFVPFFILAALGLSELEPASMRPAAAALVVVIALAHVVTWARKQHNVAWSAAVHIAVTGLSARDAVGVAPHYAKAVVSYYLRADRSAPNVEGSDAIPPPTVVIIADNFHKPEVATLIKNYPRLLGDPPGLTVRSR